MLQNLERIFIRVNEALVVLMMMAMVSLVLLNVVTRYGFQFSVAWAEELARFLMIWTVYLGAGLALRAGNHVAFEYMQSLLPAQVIPWVRGLIALVILVFLALLTYYGWEFSQLMMRPRTAMLGIPRGIVGLSIPIGAAVLGLHLLMTLRQFVQAGIRDGPSAPSPAGHTPEAPQ